MKKNMVRNVLYVLMPALLMTTLISVTTTASAKERLIYCSEGNPEGFTPMLFTTGTTFDASAMPIFNRLIQFKKGTAEMEMALAHSVEVSGDGKNYTFHLRNDVPFHTNKQFKPTRLFNADDVLFTFQRMLDPKHPWHQVSGGNYQYYYNQGIIQNIAQITAPNPQTVIFTLHHPDATFLSNMGHPAGSILSAEYADQMMKLNNPMQLDQQPIGTGPFQFVAFQRDQMVRYKAFPEYWRGKQAIDELVFSITPDPSVRAAKLLRGECDLIAYPAVTDLEALRQHPEIRLQQAPAMNIGYIALNTKKPPLDQVVVRQALSHAVNKKALIEAIYQGLGVEEKNPYPPTIWSYYQDTKDQSYDPQRAKALLDKAGVSDFNLTLWAMPVSRPYNPNARKMAEMIQADWKKIGVNAQIVSVEWAEYIQRTNNGEHDAMMFGWTTANGDPDNFVYPLLSCDAAKTGGNKAFWCHQTFNDLITQARRIQDKTQRTALYEKAQIIFKEEAPWIPIAHSIMVAAMREHVQNYHDSPFSLHEFEGVTIDREHNSKPKK